MNITLQRIRQLAEEQGRTLTYLCEKIGMKGRSYFTDIEKKSRDIPEDKLQILADTLGTTTDYLLGNTDSPLAPSATAPALFLTEHEAKVLTAYRNQPDMQPAVDRLLGITENGVIVLSQAARSAEHRKPGYEQKPVEKWTAIENAPETDDDLL